MNPSRFPRRRLLTAGVVAAGAAAAGTSPRRPPASGRPPVVVSTWRFGQPANDTALRTLAAVGSLLDAVVAGIGVVEADPVVESVGRGGIPNAEGVVQLDACIMDGPTHRAGSVCALEATLHPVAVARAVMERTRHVMLAGEGARRFARANGFDEVDLLTDEQREKWQRWKASQPPAAAPASHDTIALLILGTDGNLAGGCSTSGLAYKLPGRVGDSPIIGSGLYVDNDVGAAGATGVGENILRFCGSFQVVEFMRQGRTPEEACVATIRRIQSKHERGADLAVNFVALDKTGRFGAAGTGKGFPFAAACPDFSSVQDSAAVR